MSWFWLAIIGPVLYSVGNHIDKFLIEKYFKARSMGSLILFSSMIGLFVAPIIFIFKPNVLNIGLFNIFVLFVSAVMYLVFLWSYFKAMENDEASIVIPFFQLIPVFAFILGYFFLGETITKIQFFAMFLILAGATVLSFEIDEENKFKLRRNTVLFMILSSFASAIDSVIYKYVILQEDFWISSFWTYIFIGFIGAVILVTFKVYRRDFLYILKHNSSKIIGLNVLNEGLSIVGNLAITFATLLAPVALVLLANAYQPVFVLIIGILLTIFFPKIVSEKIQLKHLIQKILVIGVMLIGTYLLFI
jgi:drug/metabolite transporter (DMT)-like permease